jgi:hypothetical protein
VRVAPDLGIASGSRRSLSKLCFESKDIFISYFYLLHTSGVSTMAFVSIRGFSRISFDFVVHVSSETMASVVYCFSRFPLFFHPLPLLVNFYGRLDELKQGILFFHACVFLFFTPFCFLVLAHVSFLICFCSSIRFLFLDHVANDH